jgi:hypothetical protein
MAAVCAKMQADQGDASSARISGRGCFVLQGASIALAGAIEALFFLRQTHMKACAGNVASLIVYAVYRSTRE